ncbi:MAG: transcriptional repressor [Candidatus Omnitrophota bacterium]|nr:transcriptional repressor [Candidatus Omnitrophota bacterium]
MDSPNNVFTQYLKANGIRQSTQRDSILEVFLGTEKHLSAIELYNLVRRRHPNIGYATVYRAVKVICNAGLAEEVDFGDGVARFEHKYGHEHHDHLICTKCGKFIEVRQPNIEKLQEDLAKEYRFIPTRHKFQIFGICKNCKKYSP